MPVVRMLSCLNMGLMHLVQPDAGSTTIDSVDIARSGCTTCFLDDQNVCIASLKKAITSLYDFVDQKGSKHRV
ncbi:hypothetical protein L914_15984 [Phytophthora nicotianae]|uniref:Uncharacterized protein n=2 Tax=Phytophthora nicotianae TaxID=4792 RepID=V9EH50_PHYNI|nr:hypothetical protein F443_16632 [Phytophthora nicotianae P1569]ETM37465.1 hypothetical protein L914_15984 [Phytophthora nicotianae]